ncbi:MAG TPA: phospholipase [Acetobacteraceae bacterium]|nr:phospholipase [Acetobacteraceae bacterium]
MEQLNVVRWGPASGGPPRQAVVLCHGVGADAHDLIDLAPTWSRALPDALFIAPDAPEPYEMAPVGRQWFSLADRTPAVLDAGARRAAPMLLDTIEAELRRAGLPLDMVALMGFSQGAMMVLHAGLRRIPPPRAILAYSGAMLDSLELDEEMSGRPSVLLVHGEADEVVPFARGPAAEAHLRRLGLQVTTLWRPDLGHGIDDVGLMEGGLFLQRVFAA